DAHHAVWHNALLFLFAEFFLPLRRFRSCCGCWCSARGCGVFWFFGHFVASPLRTLLARHGLLLCCDGALPRTLARARVGVRSLTAHRKIPAVTQAAIALNFNQSADVHLHFFAEVAFHAPLGLNGGANPRDLIFGEVFDFLGGIHFRLFSERTRARLANAVDGGEADPEPLVGRQINTCNACHTVLSLTLSLPVLWIRTDHAHHAAPMHNLALHTDFLYRCPYFHFPLQSFRLPLFVTIHNPSARQVVWRKLDGYAIPRKYADEIFPHLS